MADENDVSKLDVYVVTGFSNAEQVTKLDIYAIVNSNPPPAPTPLEQGWIYG